MVKPIGSLSGAASYTLAGADAEAVEVLLAAPTVPTGVGLLSPFIVLFYLDIND